MHFTIRQYAPEGTKFAPGSFAKSVGKDLPVSFPSGSTNQVIGRVVEANVAEDGGSVEITLELSEEDRLKHLRAEDLQEIGIKEKWSKKTLMDQYLSMKGYARSPMEEKWVTIWK